MKTGLTIHLRCDTIRIAIHDDDTILFDTLSENDKKYSSDQLGQNFVSMSLLASWGNNQTLRRFRPPRPGIDGLLIIIPLPHPAILSLCILLPPVDSLIYWMSRYPAEQMFFNQRFWQVFHTIS